MATKQRPRPAAPTLRLTPSAQAPGGRQGPGGLDQTVGQLIIDQVKAGVDLVNAAGVAGVTAAELTGWIREGTMVRHRLGAGADWTKDFTNDQQDQAIFADEIVRAHSAHIATLSVISEQLARGGLTKTTTRRKTVAGSPVELHETVETMLPDADMVKWKLEKLEPQVYGAKATLNVTVTDMTDSDTVGDTWEKRMREVAATLTAELAIETTATEDQ